ncbi:MAG: hypothetical protein Q9181_003190 [Wetmoreana brouardii]
MRAQVAAKEAAGCASHMLVDLPDIRDIMMQKPTFSLSVLLFSIFIVLTLQVNIKVTKFEGGLGPCAFYYQNVRPGYCVKWLHPASPDLEQIDFQSLTASDIAAVWTRRTSDSDIHIEACSGAVLQSRAGPGDWRWTWSDPPSVQNWRRATGASYISLPKNLPPDAAASKWLAMEGVLGFVWGGGKWFVNDQAYDTASHMLLPGTSGPFPRSRFRRDIRSEVKGTVFAQSPTRWIYPTFVEVKGANYTHGGEGGLVYRNDAGATLNLTALGDP